MNINATLFGQMITFAIFIWFTMKFVWPPILKAMHERRKKIADGLAQADESKLELEKARREIEKLISDAKVKANGIVEQGHTRATKIVDDAREEAITEGKRLLEIAQSEIETERNSMKEQMRKEMSNLIILAAQQLLQSEVDPQKHQQLMKQMISRI